jgi:hypothetical protein
MAKKKAKPTESGPNVREYAVGALKAETATSSDIASWAGCTRAYVHRLRAEMVEEGVLAEVPRGLRGAGRESHSPSLKEARAHVRRVEARIKALKKRLALLGAKTLKAQAALMRSESRTAEARAAARELAHLQG